MRVIDGSGAPWFMADVGVRGDAIAVVGRADEPARRVVDGDGLVLCPGFIDIHSHSDFTLWNNPGNESRITQGVTTEVVGNCGAAPGPVTPTRRAQLAGLDDDLAGADWSWTTLGEFWTWLVARGVATNVVGLVGHGSVRVAVMGFAPEAPTPDQLAEMERLVAQAMADGAVGISSGLEYPPACFAATDELVSLARVAAAAGGIYTTHLRDEGDGLVDSVAEAIRIGREAGIPVQVSHHKAMLPQNFGRVHETLGMMAAARRQGVDVRCDVYPYVASSTGLAALLPDWAHAGGREAMLARLADPASRRRLAAELAGGDFDRVVVSDAGDGPPGWVGRTVEELATAAGRPPAEALLDIIRDGGGKVGMIHFGMDEADVRTVLASPLSLVGSDGVAATPGRGRGRHHPRTYGAFARVLGRYVREQGVLGWEQAIAKMTGHTAARVRLGDRGLVRPGLAADLVLFDPAAIADRATFDDPEQYAAGVRAVWVNGQPVVWDGEVTGARPGRHLRPLLAG